MGRQERGRRRWRFHRQRKVFHTTAVDANGTKSEEQRRKTMSSKIASVLTVTILVMTLLTGLSCAGDQQAQGTEVLLKGSINMNNQFVDEAGQTYDLAINDKTQELLNMPPQVLELKGTVMEKDGKKTLRVTEIGPAN